MIGSSTGAPLPSRPAGDPRRPTPFCSLIRDARFPATVNDVVVTVGDARHQDVVDRIGGMPTKEWIAADTKFWEANPMASARYVATRAPLVTSKRMR